MRRKLVAGIVLLGVAAVADLIWVETRSHAPAGRGAAPAIDGGVDAAPAPHAGAQHDPIRTLATVPLRSDPPTGDVTLIVRGAGAKCFVTVGPANGSPASPAVRECTGRDLTFDGLDAGDYQLCVDAACRPITIAAAPHEQTIDLATK